MTGLSDNEVAELFGLKPEETMPQLENRKPAQQATTELPLPPPPPDMQIPTTPNKIENKTTKPISSPEKEFRLMDAAGWIIASIVGGVLFGVLGLVVIGVI